MARKTIPRKDTDFDTWQKVISTKATASVEAWHLDAMWMNNLFTPAYEVWTKAWDAYNDPTERNKMITFEKNEARDKYELLLRKLVKMLEASTYVTDDDRMAVGIYPPAPPTPSPVPKKIPLIVVDTSTVRVLVFGFHDDDTKSHAKPHGVHGMEMKWGILESPPKSIDELIHSSFDTKSPLPLTFSEEERGRTVYFCGRWENTRGEKGPWSLIMTAIVP
jgi:hypothetical protein